MFRWSRRWNGIQMQRRRSQNDEQLFDGGHDGQAQLGLRLLESFEKGALLGEPGVRAGARRDPNSPGPQDRWRPGG